MTVRFCAGNCPRFISVSAVPGGNPMALADPKNWAVNYVTCPSCERSWCDRCHTKLGADRCPDCHQTFTHHYVTDAAAGPTASSPTAKTPPRRGWFRRGRSDRRAARPDPQSAPPLARTFAEAQLFMELWPCSCGAEADFARVMRVIDAGGELAPTYARPCVSCGSSREFVFRLPEQDASPGEDSFGSGTPSELVDPGEWIWAADHLARSVPADTSTLDEDGRRRARRRLAFAAAAIDEVLAFIPARESAVPASAFRSERARGQYATEPGRFRRERLEVVRDTYREIVAEIDSPATVPSWCDLTPDEWVGFRDALRQALDARGDPVPPQDSDRVTIRQLDGCTFELGLDRLVNKVHGLPLAAWAPTIEGYLADQQAQAEIIRRELLGQDLARVRTLLRPRLLRGDLLPAGESSLRRDLGGDLVAVLEVEGPQTNHRVTKADAAAWDVAADELWSVAVANLGQEDHEVNQKGPVSWVSGESHYVASHALRLSEVLVDPAPHGVLVAVPHQDAVLFWPVLDGHSVVMLQMMAQAVHRLYCDSESLPLSPHLYWSAHGVFEQVGITQGDDHVTITGSEQFAALANRLLQESAERSG